MSKPVSKKRRLKRPGPVPVLTGIPAAIAPAPKSPSPISAPQPAAAEPATTETTKPGRRVKANAAKNPYRLPKARAIGRQAFAVLWQHKLLFAGITAIYLVLTLVLVRDFTGTADIDGLKTLLRTDPSKFSDSFGAFTTIVTSSGNSSSPLAGTHRAILIFTASLALIWALRQAVAEVPRIRIRDSFYQGMYPLVPEILVLVMIVVQLLPLAIGLGLFSLVISTGIAASTIEQVMWGLLALATAVVSLYWVTSSVFALYIVALPDMTPMKALRSARSLVRYRRLIVLRKIFFLPLILLIISLILGLPVILIVTSAAPLVLFLLGVIYLPIIHAYMYALYRELLK